MQFEAANLEFAQVVANVADRIQNMLGLFLDRRDAKASKVERSQTFK